MALIFGIYVNFLDEFITVSLAFLLLSPPTILLSLTLNAFGAGFSDNLVIFNRKISSAAIFLRPWIKRR